MENEEGAPDEQVDGPWAQLEYDRVTKAVKFGGTVIGEFDATNRQLVLNLGWCRLAGLGVKIDGDPKVDRRRVVVER